jgi:hypothetical protein
MGMLQLSMKAAKLVNPNRASPAKEQILNRLSKKVKTVYQQRL